MVVPLAELWVAELAELMDCKSAGYLVGWMGGPMVGSMVAWLVVQKAVKMVAWLVV